MRAALPFLLAAIALAAGSNVLLRRGMRTLRGVSTLRATAVHALRSPAVWAGTLGYVTAMGFWLEVLGRAEIGLVYPVFNGSVTVLVIGASALALGERLEPRRVAGALLMLAGIFVASLE